MLKTKHFDFIVDNFEDKVGSNLSIFSRVWYIDQCRTHVKAMVNFTETGNIKVWIGQGRNPFVMGLTPVDQGSLQMRCYLKDNGNNDDEDFFNKVAKLPFRESSSRGVDCWKLVMVYCLEKCHTMTS